MSSETDLLNFKHLLFKVKLQHRRQMLILELGDQYISYFTSLYKLHLERVEKFVLTQIIKV